MTLNEHFVFSKDTAVDSESQSQINEFLANIPTLEKQLGQKIIIHQDKKTNVNFIECHVTTETLAKNMDLDASIDPDDQGDYRANRSLQPDDPDYLKMLEDAEGGRQFSDIVIEYNTKYEPTKPLKILGGQHRSSAIKNKSDSKKHHGIRVYFNLDTNKRVELYKISNTNIQVPEDLLDRLDEQSLSPPGTLREFAYEIGFLERPRDFAEKRSSEGAFRPTVRMLRTFIVNFYKGRQYKGDIDADAITPHLATSGGIDPEYKKIFDKDPYFVNDAELLESGKNFVNLHRKQFEVIDKMDIPGKAEFRMKAITMAVLSSWACAAGLLQRDKIRLQKLYDLSSLCGKDDPLNAHAMNKARLENVDPENYRGLGTRSNSAERGRVLTLFLQYSSSDKPRITRDMCNAAIKIYHANEAKTRAEKSKKKAFG